MKRLFWLAFGITVGVLVTRRLTDVARQATPQGVAENLGYAVRELGAAVGSFGADVRAGMAERERELQVIVDRPAAGDRARRAAD